MHKGIINFLLIRSRPSFVCMRNDGESLIWHRRWRRRICVECRAHHHHYICRKSLTLKRIHVRSMEDMAWWAMQWSLRHKTRSYGGGVKNSRITRITKRAKGRDIRKILPHFGCGPTNAHLHIHLVSRVLI